MCLCDDQFQTALDSGWLAKTIDAARQPCPQNYCVSAFQTGWLNQFALRFPLNRELRHDSARKQQIYRWFAAANEEIPDAVERFWRPGGEIGVAHFSTVRRGTQEGKVCTLHVTDDGKQETRLDGDENFRRAIEWAREFVARYFGAGAASERVRRASVETGESGERFEDRSVALAALVAFFSLATRLPVLPERIFTGVPAESGQDVAPPARETLHHKLQAVKNLGEDYRLIAPPGSDKDLPSLEANAWLIVRNWQGALQEALGTDEFQRVVDELNPSGHQPPTQKDIASGILRDVLQASLLAAGEAGLSLYELELCFDRLREHYRDLEQFSTSIRSELQHLKRVGVVVESGDHWSWKASNDEPSPLLLKRVHEALAEQLERQGERARSIRHRVFLRQFRQVRETLEELLDSEEQGSSRLAALCAPMLSEVRASPALAPELLRGLEDSKTIPSALLQVVLQCPPLSGPFPRLAGNWERCEDAVDRVFWLQSVTETALHLLWVMASAKLPAEPDPQLADLVAEHGRRPSLGGMCKLLSRLLGGSSASSQDVLSTQNSANLFVSGWNNLLHNHAAWESLAQRDPKELDRSSNELARGTLSLLERLRQAGGPEVIAREAGASCPELIVDPGGAWLFRRGVLGGQVRYWSFDELRWERQAGQPAEAQPESFPPEHIRALPGLGSLNLPLDFLPTPVATAVLHLKQGLPPLRQLASIDQAFRTLLDLALPDPTAAKEAAKQAGWHLRIKRSYLEAIQCDTSATAWAGAYLRDSECRRIAFELVGLLERMEHASGPRSSWSPWLGWASSLLGALIAKSPWVRQEFSLFKSTTEGTIRLLGLHPRTINQPVPHEKYREHSWLSTEGKTDIFCPQFEKLFSPENANHQSLHSQVVWIPLGAYSRRRSRMRTEAKTRKPANISGRHSTQILANPDDVSISDLAKVHRPILEVRVEPAAFALGHGGPAVRSHTGGIHKTAGGSPLTEPRVLRNSGGMSRPAMSSGISYSMLPTPVARLVRLALQSKETKKKHDYIFTAWDVSVRLLVAVNPPRDVGVLSSPSLGTWIQAAALPAVSSDATELRELFLFLATTVARAVTSTPRKISPKELLPLLSEYRNKATGAHSGPRPDDFYARAFPLLARALPAAWEANFFLPRGDQLVYVSDVELDTCGSHLARVSLLEGSQSSPEAEGVAVPVGVLPQQVYLRRGENYQPLYPWVVFRAHEIREQFLLFNASNRGLFYLDCDTGELLNHEALRRGGIAVDDPTQERPSRASHKQLVRIPPVEERPEAEQEAETSGIAERAASYRTPPASPPVVISRRGKRGLSVALFGVGLVVFSAFVWSRRGLALSDWFFYDTNKGEGWLAHCLNHQKSGKKEAATQACERAIWAAPPTSTTRARASQQLARMQCQDSGIERLKNGSLGLDMIVASERDPVLLAWDPKKPEEKSLKITALTCAEIGSPSVTSDRRIWFHVALPPELSEEQKDWYVEVGSTWLSGEWAA